MSVLDGFKEVGERTGGKLTMTVMLESVRSVSYTHLTLPTNGDV